MSRAYELAKRADDALQEASRTLAEMDAALAPQPAPSHDVSQKYEELRGIIDGGSESATHADAVVTLRYWRERYEQPAPSEVTDAMVDAAIHTYYEDVRNRSAFAAMREALRAALAVRGEKR